MSEHRRTPTQIIRDLRKPENSEKSPPQTQPPPPPQPPEAPSPTQSLAALRRPCFQVSQAPNLSPEVELFRSTTFIHLAIDKSGSFCCWEEQLQKLSSQLVYDLVEDGLEDSVQIAVTEMSGIAVSAPYQPLRKFRARNIPAGGGSPHAAMLAEARKVDAPLIGSRRGNVIRIIACDGEHSEPFVEVLEEINWLRKAQTIDPQFHVFTVRMGVLCNDELLSLFSIKRPHYDCLNGDFEQLRKDLRKLVNAAAIDPTVPGRTMTLREIPRPAREGGGHE